MAQARPEDIEYVSRLKFGSQFNYTPEHHGKEDVEGDNCFNNISTLIFDGGDEIRVDIKRNAALGRSARNICLLCDPWFAAHRNQIEAEILETSELITKSLKESDLPKEIRIGAVVRGKNIIIPKSDFVFEKKDLVVFLSKREHLEKVESLFRISSLV